MLSHKFVLPESENFTSGPAIRAPPTIPINHYFSSRNQQNRTASKRNSKASNKQRTPKSTSKLHTKAPTNDAEVLSYYSMLIYSRHKSLR